MAMLWALACIGQTVPPEIVRKIEPEYGAIPSNFVLDPASITLRITDHGEISELESYTSLPDNVVRALMQWKFKPGRIKGKPVPYSLVVTFTIRRSPSEMQFLAFRPASGDFSAVGDTVTEARRMTESRAREVAKDLKDDANSAALRARLIAYSAEADSDEWRKLHGDQLAWFVENQPGAAILALPVAMIYPTTPQDREAFERVKAIWLEKLAKFPDDFVVLGHATYFLRISDPELAAEILIPYIAKFGNAAVWLGEVYGYSAMGAKKLDKENGLPIEADPVSAEGFGAKVRAALIAMNDARVVLSALTAVNDGLRSLAGANAAGDQKAGYEQKDAPRVDYCKRLLDHARSLTTEVITRCEDPPIQPGAVITIPKSTNRIPPEYPASGKLRGEHGSVHFRAVIGEDGTVRTLEFLGGRFAFYESARQALLQWKFKGPMRFGVPSAMGAVFDSNFGRP